MTRFADSGSSISSWVALAIGLVGCSRRASPPSATPATAGPPSVVCHLDPHMVGCPEPWAINGFGLFQGGTVHATAHRTGEHDLELTIVTPTVDASIRCTIRIHGGATGPTASSEISERYSDVATSPVTYTGDLRLSCFPFPKGAEVDCEVTLMRPGSARLELYQACVKAVVE